MGIGSDEEADKALLEILKKIDEKLGELEGRVVKAECMEQVHMGVIKRLCIGIDIPSEDFGEMLESAVKDVKHDQAEMHVVTGDEMMSSIMEKIMGGDDNVQH